MSDYLYCNPIVWGKSSVYLTDLPKYWKKIAEHDPSANEWIQYIHVSTIMIKNKESWIMAHMTQYPYQCGILTLGGIDVYATSKNTWDLFHKVSLNAANALHYTKITVTLIAPESINGFTNLGYKTIDTFINRRTNNKVHLLTYQVL